MNKSTLPWASGPGELLKHGLKLLEKDTDSNRRIAMICIDNAVELMMKTFLGLPTRINGIKIKRSDLEEISESFPKIIDAIEVYASDKIKGISLGEIEWFHRLRNELYHQGNGLTVEKNNADVYAEIANLLFLNLFGVKLFEEQGNPNELLGQFMLYWSELEKIMKEMCRSIDENIKIHSYGEALKFLHRENILNTDEYQALEEIRVLRNEVVHGEKDHSLVIDQNLVNSVRGIGEMVRVRTKEKLMVDFA